MRSNGRRDGEGWPSRNADLHSKHLLMRAFLPVVLALAQITSAWPTSCAISLFSIAWRESLQQPAHARRVAWSLRTAVALPLSEDSPTRRCGVRTPVSSTHGFACVFLALLWFCDHWFTKLSNRSSKSANAALNSSGYLLRWCSTACRSAIPRRHRTA